MPSRGWVRGAIWLGLALFVLVAFADVIGPGRGLAFRDHVLVFRPWFWSLVEALRAGTLPTLTRASPAGVPLEALFISAYTPSTLVLFLGDFDVVYDLFVASFYVILAVGAFELARELGAKPLEAALAGGVAALAGPVLSFENLLGATAGLAWAPWVYLCLARVLRAPSLAGASVLAITTAFHLQGIMPELVVMDVAALAILLVALRPPLGARLAAVLGLAAVLAVAMASIRLMPVYHALQGTTRATGFPYAIAAQRPLTWAGLVELFVPAFWTPPEIPFLTTPPGPLDVRVADTPEPAYLTTLYFGTALAPALVGLASLPRRSVQLLLAAGAALFFLLALGPETPVHRLWFALPAMDSVRYPVKWLVPCAALLAAGLPRGLTELGLRPKRLFFVTVLQLAAVVAVLMTARLPELVEWAGSLSAHAEPGFAGITRADIGAVHAAAVGPRLAHALVALALAALILGAAVTKAELRPKARVAYVALVLFDLALAGRFAIVGADVRLRPPPAVLQAIESDERRFFSIAPNNRPVKLVPDANETLFAQRAGSNLERGVWLHRHVRPYEDWNRDATSNPLAALRFRAVQHLRGQEARRALGRAGVAWGLSPWRDDTPGAWSFEVPGEPPHWVLPMEAVRPYVHAYARWRTTDAATWSMADLRSNYLADDAQEIAVVRDGVATATTAPEGCAPKVKKDEPASTPERVLVDVESTCPALVVALEPMVSGWAVTVDGADAKLLDAELGYLGVMVGAGQHRVRFEYRAETPRWVPVSVGAAVLALGLWVFGRRRREA